MNNERKKFIEDLKVDDIVDAIKLEKYRKGWSKA